MKEEKIKKIKNKNYPKLLTLVTIITITLILSFMPNFQKATYYFNIFVTFIHEGSHALVALLTGGKILSLSVKADGSGVVYSTSSGFIGQILTSSAGYLGAIIFGIILLILTRCFSSKKIIYFSSFTIFFITIFFSVISPMQNNTPFQIKIENNSFTIIAGLLLSLTLFIIGKVLHKVINDFLILLLSTQCLLNAVIDLKTLFIISSSYGNIVHNDAVNMENVTGIPSIVWAILWIWLSILMILMGLKIYIKPQRRKLEIEPIAKSC